MISGVFCLALSFLVFTLVLVGCRNPRRPKWANESWTGNFVIPGMIGLMAMGVGLVVQYITSIGTEGIDLKAVGISIGMIAASLSIFRMLRVKEKLAGFAEQQRDTCEASRSGVQAEPGTYGSRAQKEAA